MAALGLALLVLTTPNDELSGRPDEKVGSGERYGLHGAADGEDYVAAFETAAGHLARLASSRGWKDPETLQALHRVALIAHLGGDQDTAEEAVDLALRMRERVLGRAHPRTIESLVLRGVVAKYANDVDLAMQCYDRALAALPPRPENLPLIADALVGRAHAMRVDRAAPDDLVAVLRQALALRRRAGEREGLGLADNLVWLGWVLFNGGRHEEARPVLDEAERVLVASGLENNSLMGTTLTCQADLHVLRHEWSESEPLYRRGLGILERCRDDLLPGFSRRKLSLRGYDDLATLQLLAGRGEEAWRSLQKLRNNVSLDLASLSRWAKTDPDGHARALQLYERLPSFERSKASSGAPGSRELDTLVAKLETLAPLRRLERDYVARARPRDVGPGELRSHLPPRTAYIGWLHSRLGNRLGRSRGEILESAWIYVIRPDAPLRWVPLWSARTDEEEKRRLNPVYLCHERYKQASDWPLRVVSDPDLDRASRELWNGWLAPAIPYLEGIDRLIVEYSVEFPRTPLESLLDQSGHPVGDRFACAYVPSAATYMWLRDEGRSKPLQSRPALALGGAVFTRHAGTSEPPPTGSTVLDPVLLRKALAGDAASLDRLPMLPFSLEEARTVASLFPDSELLSGAEASERRLGELARSGKLAKYGVVHLATHMLSECYPERSAFALSRLDLDGTSSGDGLLRSREVLASWSLDADLLVLSGCQSARSCGWDDGEYVGFTQALMAVGAKSVVASLWKVDDRATALLMTRFYHNLTGKGIDSHGDPIRSGALQKDLALAEAKQWLRSISAEDGSRPYSHPVYWAGFVLFGPGD